MFTRKKIKLFWRSGFLWAICLVFRGIAAGYGRGMNVIMQNRHPPCQVIIVSAANAGLPRTGGF